MGLGKILATKLTRVEQDLLIERLCKTILEHCHPSRIVLFGSATRREMTEASDLDVVVIVETLSEVKPTQKALNQLSRLIDWPVDCLVVDRALFERRASLGGVFAVAQEEGEVLRC